MEVILSFCLIVEPHSRLTVDDIEVWLGTYQKDMNNPRKHGFIFNPSRALTSISGLKI